MGLRPPHAKQALAEGQQALMEDVARRSRALDDAERRFAEIEERLDFAERLLAKQVAPRQPAGWSAGGVAMAAGRRSAVVLLLLFACRSGSESMAPATLRRDSAGVILIDNTGPDRPLDWQLDPIATIGGPGSGIDLAQLTEYTVDADTLGHIFLLDSWFGQRLQLIDTAGHLIRTLTRQGSGPGEVGQGVAISATGDGTVAIMDFSKTGLVRVRWNGEVLPILRLAGYDLFGGARASADTVVVHTLETSERTQPEHLRYRTATDTATLAAHTPERLGWLPFCRSGMEGLTPMLAPELLWTARGSVAAVSRTAEYRIDLFHAGRLTHTIRRDVAGRPGTVEAVRRFFPEGKIIGGKNCVVPAEELAAKRGVARALQPIRRLAIDWTGRLWVERSTFPDETPRTDLFDSTGSYLGTLTGLGAPLGFPSRGLLVFALPDSATDEPKLRIFRRTHP